jgi:hypothetical protein
MYKSSSSTVETLEVCVTLVRYLRSLRWIRPSRHLPPATFSSFLIAPVSPNLARPPCPPPPWPWQRLMCLALSSPPQQVVLRPSAVLALSSSVHLCPIPRPYAHAPHLLASTPNTVACTLGHDGLDPLALRSRRPRSAPTPWALGRHPSCSSAQSGGAAARGELRLAEGSDERRRGAPAVGERKESEVWTVSRAGTIFLFPSPVIDA